MAQLDADQQAAAAHRVGTAAVAAAAGSGKTTLLVARAIALVEGGERPESVLTLAFNRNAAQTLRERLASHPATRGSEDRMASTFHAFAFSCVRLVTPDVRVLATSAQEAAEGASRGRQEDSRQTLRDVARGVWNEMGGNRYGNDRPELIRGVELDKLLELEPSARERLFSKDWVKLATAPTPDALQEALTTLQLKDVTTVELRALASLMRGFRRAKHSLRVVDFTDMLLALGHYIRVNEPRVMARLRQLRHLQVDEAQDGNELRWYIAQAIADFKEGRSVMAVGDLRQSIAGFAGAQPELFKRWWNTCDAQFTLPRNYRSASAIVEAGNAIAMGEPWNVGGDSIAARTDLGRGSVRVEALGPLAIAVEMASGIKDGTYNHKGVTVLARTKAALEPVAFGLRAQGIRAFVRGGGNAWRGIDGRMIRAYLDLADHSVRDIKALGMALNRPLRYVSGARLAGWVTSANPSYENPAQLNQRLYGDATSYRPAAAVVEAVETLAELPWEERVLQVESWLIEGLAHDAAENQSAPGDTSDRADLIHNLCVIATTCRDVASLDVAIEAEGRVNPNDPDVVELSTIHRAKGDQWHTVYVVGVKEGIFPHVRATSDEEEAEETRLLYVAVTRPVKALVVSVIPNEVDRFGPKIDRLRVIADSTAESPDPTPGPGPKAPPPAPEPLVEAPKPVPAPAGGYPTAHAMTGALLADEPRAHDLTDKGVQPQPGERFVPVSFSEMEVLLVPHGFVEDEATTQRTGQRVMASRLADGARLLVYTTVPPGQQGARGNGEDSIKVGLLDATGKPLARRQPYAARTRNWRVTLLKRLAEVLKAHPSLKG